MDFLTLQNDFKNDYNKALIENTEFLEARKYYNGNQLPPDVLKIILERGQTPIVENMFKVIVNKILGYKIESISEIRLSPKQEEDRALSDLLNSLLQSSISPTKSKHHISPNKTNQKALLTSPKIGEEI